MFRNSVTVLMFLTACGDTPAEQTPAPSPTASVEVTDPETTEALPGMEDASETVDPVTATTSPTEPTDQTTAQ